MDPGTAALGRDERDAAQDAQVVRDRRLREVEARLDVADAEGLVLAIEHRRDAQARRITERAQDRREIVGSRRDGGVGVREVHDRKLDPISMNVNASVGGMFGGRFAARKALHLGRDELLLAPPLGVDVSARPGTITAFDLQDGLGWIDLDDGERVRVGGNAMKGRWPEPIVGVRVLVHETAPGFGGNVRATRVTPLEAPAAPAPPPPAPPARRIAWPELVRRHPRFSDLSATAAPCARACPPLALTPHPLFDPWREEIGRGVTRVGLNVPTWRARDPIDPTPADSFALGRVAFLETSEWPRCGLCHRALMMCTQLAPDLLTDFTSTGRGLVAMFCFSCGIAARKDPRVGFVRWVTPRHRVEGDDVFADDNQRALQSVPQRVTAQAPQLLLPDTSWLRYRSRVVSGTASSLLFGDDAPEIDELPADVEPDMLDDVDATFEEWIAPQRPRGTWGGASLGGGANWDQRDETPSCAHGEQLHLLDYEGGQFLDGALHVFVCREGICDLGFVAEF